MSTILALKASAPSKVVQVSDSEGFAVRGLSPYQVVALYRRHAGELEPLFQRIVAGAKAGAAQLDDVDALVVAIGAEAPDILAEVLTLASGGDPDDVTDATIMHPATGEPVTLQSFDAAMLLMKHLPLSVQIDALAKIAELSFTSDMPSGKFFALAASLAKKVTGAMKADAAISAGD